jgi:hypothetical protein
VGRFFCWKMLMNNFPNKKVWLKYRRIVYFKNSANRNMGPGKKYIVNSNVVNQC